MNKIHLITTIVTFTMIILFIGSYFELSEHIEKSILLGVLKDNLLLSLVFGVMATLVQTWAMKKLPQK